MTKKLVVPSLVLLALLALSAGCAVHARPGYVAVEPAPVYVPPPPRVHVRVAPRRCSHMECRRVCNMWGCHDRCRRVYHACY